MAEKYIKNGIMLYADSSMTVDWARLKHEKMLGGIFRMGKIPWVSDSSGNIPVPQTKASDAWMDAKESEHRGNLVANGLLALGMIEIDPGYWLNCGWEWGTCGRGVQGLLDGTVPEVAEKLMKYSPELNLLARKTKRGAGRVPAAAALKDLEDWNADGWLWLLQTYALRNNQVIGDGWTNLATSIVLNGARLLADNGYIPKQADKQAVITSEWFLSTYGKPDTLNQVARWDGVPQGNRWKAAKDGVFQHTDIGALVERIGTIEDSFQIANIGAGVAGKVVLAYKVTSNCGVAAITDNNGNATVTDVYSMNVAESALLVRYPKWAKRRSAAPAEPDPEPEEPETPAPTYGKIMAEAGLRLRPTPAAGGAYYGVLPKGFEVDVLETAAAGSDLWVRIARDLWLCARQGINSYIQLA